MGPIFAGVMTVVEKSRKESRKAEQGAQDSSRYELARLLAFAFCSADALIETSADGEIEYASGATRHLFGGAPEELSGRPLSTLAAKEDMAVLDALLKQVSHGERFQNIPVKISRPEKGEIVISLSGYSVPDLSNHCFFTARAVDTAKSVTNGPERDAASGMLTADAFGDQVRAHFQEAAAGGSSGVVSIVGLTGMSELADRLEDDEQKALLRRLGVLLKSASVGGDGAALLGEDRFGVLHEPGMDLANVEGQISEVARIADPKGVGVSVTSQSIDTDRMDLNGGMSPRRLSTPFSGWHATAAIFPKFCPAI